MKVGEENLWQPGRRYRHADDHAIAQIYLDLFQISKENRMVAPFRTVVDRMMASSPRWPKEYQPIDYWWCDALFMSPPALAKLAEATGEEKYLVFLDRLWREAHRLLYDQEERLFYRDLRHKGGEKKVFWSRGNAWVLAGLARLLDSMPESSSDRRFYLVVYREIAERIAGLQPPDGLWRTNLLESPAAAPGESSGTALFCFALAWGIHQGVLDRERFLPIVMAAWSALRGNLDEDGRLGWVQRPGVGPSDVRPEDSEVYGTGALLLAGSEVLGLVTGQDPVPPSDKAPQ
jgi:rhamnogalacturonyl hydrolase YesR